MDFSYLNGCLELKKNIMSKNLRKICLNFILMISDVIIISEKCTCIKGLFVLNYINTRRNSKRPLLLRGHRF